MNEKIPQPDILEANSLAQAEAVKFAEQIKEVYTRKFTFLLVGRTGVGKSSTINQLLGEEIAPIGEFEPETRTVEEYRLPLNNVNFEIVDTPGLCDDLPEKGNDAEYIKQIKKRVEYIDCLLYVTQLNATRVRNDEKHGIQLITKAFGEDIWSNAVLVFTFADLVNSGKYEYTLKKRSELIRKVIEDNTSKKIASKIPSVSISNKNYETPDGKPWFSELYTTVVERISDAGFIQYLMATAPTVNLAPEQESKHVTVIEEHHHYYPRAKTPSSTSGSKKGGDSHRVIDQNSKERIRRSAEGRGLGEKFSNFMSNSVKVLSNTAKSAWNGMKSILGF